MNARRVVGRTFRDAVEWTSKHPLVTLFALALLVQLVFLQLLPAAYRVNESTDYLTFYEPVAESIRSGDGFQTPRGTPAVRYPPGYPVLLAGVFEAADVLGVSGDLAVRALIVGLTAGSAVLIFLLGRHLFGSRVGFIAALLWMTYPVNLWLAKQPNSEVPFIFVLYGTLLVLVRALDSRRRLAAIVFLCGAGLGVASLIRASAIAIAVPVAIGIFLWMRGASVRLRLALCGVLLAGNLVAVMPWEVWATATTGRVIPLSEGGRAAVLAGIIQRTGKDEFEKSAPADVKALMRRAREQRSSLRSFGDIIGFLWDEAGNHPAAVGKLLFLKAIGPWYVTFSGRLDLLVALVQVPYLALVTGGAFVAWKRGGRERSTVFLIALIGAYSWLVAVATAPRLRYLAPAFGLFLVLGARWVGLVSPAKRLSSGRRGPAISARA